MEVIDPVCKMEVDTEKASASSEYQGGKFYFCCTGCKTKFDQDPSRYAGQ
jgi:P-type Cu+ transporter